MIWGSASEFFHMGGYGMYVWGSYAVAVAALLAEAVLLGAREKRLVRRLRGRPRRGAAP